MARANRRRRAREQPAAPRDVFSPQPVRRWPAALLLIWIALVYSPSLSNGFTYDDPDVVTLASGLLSDPGQIGRLFSSDYFRLSNESTYRPFVTFTYMVDWQVGGGRPWAFHLHSVLWHLVAVSCLVALLRRLGASDGFRYASAGLYGVHPAVTEAVDAVAFREDVLVTALGLVTLLLVTGDRPRPRALRLGLGALAMTLALLAKESAVVLLALAPLTFWAMAERRRAGSWTPRAQRVEYLVLAACTLAYAVVRFVVFPASSVYGIRIGDSLFASLATGAVAFGYYAGLLLYPFALCADYRGVVPFVTSALDWRLWLALVALVGLSYAAWRWRRQEPLGFWGWSWFLVALLPVSNLVPIPAFMAERFLHLPFVGLVVALAATVRQVIVRTARSPRPIVAGAAIATLLLMSAVTWRRHAAWSSDEGLWATTLRDHPTSQGALHGYGSALIQQGRYADGMAYLQQLLQDSTVGRERRAAVAIELGAAYDRLGQPDAARRAFEQALAAAPDVRAHLGLAMIAYRADELDDAKRHAEAAVRLQPDSPEALGALGAVLSRLGRRADAIAAWREAVRVQPSLASAHANLGVALGAEGDVDGGIAALDRALALDAGQAPWHLAIARLLIRRGRTDEAVQHLQTALRLDPGFEPARDALRALSAR
ncbi:MAG: tetratricopeptide repeat protein [Acidobacteria bacterium]|nr:tetratricopeptide repeat protein [Acidobacteriota bacterium]